MTTLEGTTGRAAVGLWTTTTRGRTLDTTGMAHLPRTGGAVLALTHLAHHELALVELAIWRHSRRRIRSLVLNGRVEEPRAGGVLRPLRRIFVDLTAGPQAYTAALTALRDGEIVALFAEAAGDSPVAARELRISAARLAIEAGVPLLPVVVWSEDRAPSGAFQHVRSPGSGGWQRVAIGAPIPMDPAEDVRAVTDELRSTMQRMLLALVCAGRPARTAPR